MRKGIWAAMLLISVAALPAGAATRMTVYLDDIGTTNPVNFALYLPVNGDFQFSNFAYGPAIPASWRRANPTVLQAGTGDLFAFGSLADAGTAMPDPSAATGTLDPVLYPPQDPAISSAVPVVLASFDYEGTLSSPDAAPGFWAVYGPNGNKQKKTSLVNFSASRVDLSTAPLAGMPVADAGADQTVTEGATATLDGSASTHAAGTTATYEWVETVGVPVTLSDPAAPNPSFTAPEVDAAGTSLTFELTVTDDQGLASTATTTVQVDDSAAQVADGGGGGGCFITATGGLGFSGAWALALPAFLLLLRRKP